MAESGMGFLGRGSEPPPHQLGCLGSAVSSPSGKFGFWKILGPQKLRQNGQLSFESEGQQVNLGTRAPCPNVESPLTISFLSVHNLSVLYV